MKKIINPVLTSIFFLPAFVFAQTPVNVAINFTGASADAKALLDVSAGDKGILIPRIALTASNSSAPIGSGLPASLMVYNTATAGTTPNNVIPGYYYWDGIKWVALGGGSGGLDWSLSGNAGTAGTNFIGTTDNMPFNIRVNNQKAGRISSADNLFIGYLAGSNSNAAVIDNVAIGDSALYTQSYAGAFSSQNVAIGNSALFSNNPTSASNGNKNTAAGNQSLRNNTTGKDNTAIGFRALSSNTSGSENTATGLQSLYRNTTGNANTAMGLVALSSNTTGYENVAIGNESLYANTSGGDNTAIGHGSLNSNTTGNKNTASGFNALMGNTTGFNNIAVGYQAGDNISTGANNIILGYDIDAPSPTGSNQLSIGNLIFGTGLNGTGAAISTGNIGIGTASPGAKLQIDGIPGAEAFRVNTGIANGADLSIKYGGANEIVSIGSWTNGGIQFYSSCCGYTNPADGSIKLYPRTGNIVCKGTVTASCGVLVCSDSRYKKDITQLEGSLNKIKQIKGYTYHWRAGEFPQSDFNENEQVGFIAQELERIFPQVVFTDENGFKTVDYAKITPVLVEAIKEQQKIIEELKAANTGMNQRLEKAEELLGIAVKYTQGKK